MTNVQQLTDKAAIVFSSFCVVHCIAMPLLFFILPTLPSLYVLEHQLFHEVILFAVIPIGLVGLVLGYLHHKSRYVLVTGVMGLVLLTNISIFGHGVLSEQQEMVLTSIASLVIIYAHVKNFQLRPANTNKTSPLRAETDSSAN